MVGKNTKKETPKKEVISSGKFKITKPSGKVIYRENIGDYAKVYKAKGYKVEEV